MAEFNFGEMCDSFFGHKFHVSICMFNLRIFAIKKAVSKFADLVCAGKNKWTLMLTKSSANAAWSLYARQSAIQEKLGSYLSEVDSSRTSLASRTHFEVLGLGLEASSPWPRNLRSSKIALSFARGQHYFLNRWNFVGKCQRPRGKFANTFFAFRNWSIGLAKRV